MKPEIAVQSDKTCHVCQSPDMQVIGEFSSLAQVTSDCRPWKRGGQLGICLSCGFVQKITDDAFLRDCEAIYRSYEVYYQAGGEEQKVFDQSRGLSMSRSESILAQLLKENKLPFSGTLLDVGCGNGNLLKSFSKHCPQWSLSGLEFDEKNRNAVEAIAHVDQFYSCDLSKVPASFDLISMIHCLEHISDPRRFLLLVKEKLNRDGMVLIEIPDYTQNPFDLVIADHCTHFDVCAIRQLLEQCGFEPVLVSTEFVSKEITVLARVNDEVKETTRMTSVQDSQRRLSEAIAWLIENIACATRIADHEELGIFGTSIAGVWLYNEIPERVSFFVDEDEARIGRSFLERKVYHPRKLPNQGQVFIPLPHKIAGGIAARLNIYGDRFIIPPPL